MGELVRLARPVFVGAAMAAVAIGCPAGAQSPDSTRPAAGAATADPTGPAMRTRIDTSKQELRGLTDDLSASDAQQHARMAELEAIRTDRVRLNAALLDTTARVQATEQRITSDEERLDTMSGSKDAIEQSLENRRGVIANVLAALQRMGRRPPPAILVRPDDILGTIRTSMLLGAVVPELRSDAEALANDLADLQRLGLSIKRERDTLTGEVADLKAEHLHLDGLVEARQAAQAQAEGALGSEREHAAELAQHASGLKELIARLEGEVAAAKRVTDAALTADDLRRRAAETDADGIRARVAAGRNRDPARLSPGIDFADAKAMLFLPVNGRLRKAYGAADEFGGTEKGVSIATRPEAVVAAPSDGWVLFSGPYRTYGQILIINAGGGYYIVLAGMNRVSVAPGQFVLAGEPVASMGDGSVRTAAAISLGATEPILYVEFRKDGTAVDPSPWWAKAELEKVRG